MTAPSSTSVSPAPGGRRKKSAGAHGQGLGPGAHGQGLGTPVKDSKDKGSGLDQSIDREHHHPVGWVRTLSSIAASLSTDVLSILRLGRILP